MLIVRLVQVLHAPTLLTAGEIDQLITVIDKLIGYHDYTEMVTHLLRDRELYDRVTGVEGTGKQLRQDNISTSDNYRQQLNNRVFTVSEMIDMVQYGEFEKAHPVFESLHVRCKIDAVQRLELLGQYEFIQQIADIDWGDLSQYLLQKIIVTENTVLLDHWLTLFPDNRSLLKIKRQYDRWCGQAQIESEKKGVPFHQALAFVATIKYCSSTDFNMMDMPCFIDYKQAYETLLPVIRFAHILFFGQEFSESHAEMNAAKLAFLFRNQERAIDYLALCHVHDAYSLQSATDFDFPRPFAPDNAQGVWNVSMWAHWILSIDVAMTQLLLFAVDIENTQYTLAREWDIPSIKEELIPIAKAIKKIEKEKQKEAFFFHSKLHDNDIFVMNMLERHVHHLVFSAIPDDCHHAMQALIHLLKNNRILSSLQVIASDTSLSESYQDDIVQLINALNSNRRLRTLNLEQAPLGYSGLLALNHVLLSNQYLENIIIAQADVQLIFTRGCRELWYLLAVIAQRRQEHARAIQSFLIAEKSCFASLEALCSSSFWLSEISFGRIISYMAFNVYRCAQADLSALEGHFVPQVKLSDMVIAHSLGKGSYGSVSAALYGDRWVAIKLLKVHTGKMLQHFLSELRIHSRLSHPNIVTLLGYSIAPDHHGLIMELMTFSLDDLLKCRDLLLPPDKRLSLSRDIAEGLRYLHEKNALHLDLKSQNILVNRHGDDYKAKIADFGSSIVGDVGTPGGTRRWFAPEVLTGTRGQPSDVFALGRVMWQIVTRLFPFQHIKKEKDLIPLLMKGVCEPLPNNTHRDIAVLIDDCLEKLPEDRPKASVVVTRLDHFKASKALFFKPIEHDGQFQVDPSGLSALNPVRP